MAAGKGHSGKLICPLFIHIDRVVCNLDVLIAKPLLIGVLQERCYRLWVQCVPDVEEKLTVRLAALGI